MKTSGLDHRTLTSQSGNLGLDSELVTPSSGIPIRRPKLKGSISRAFRELEMMDREVEIKIQIDAVEMTVATETRKKVGLFSVSHLSMMRGVRVQM